MILGKNIIVAIGSTPIACAKSGSLNEQKDMLPVASPTSGKWKENLPGRREWSVSVDALITTTAENLNTLQSAYDNDTLLTLRIYDTQYGYNRTGTAYIQSLNVVAQEGSLAKLTATFVGTGSLTNYSGEVINPKVLVQVMGWYYDDTGQDTFEPIDDENGLVRGLKFTLTEAATVRVIPGDVTVMFGASSLISAIQNKEMITYLQEYNQVITSTNDLQLAAGTYYMCYNYKDDTAEDPVLINLS